MNIVITTSQNGKFVDIVYNDILSRAKKFRIRRELVTIINLVSDCSCVEATYNDQIFILKYNYVDNINGVTPTDNEHFADLLMELM